MCEHKWVPFTFETYYSSPPPGPAQAPGPIHHPIGYKVTSVICPECDEVKELHPPKWKPGDPDAR